MSPVTGLLICLGTSSSSFFIINVLFSSVVVVICVSSSFFTVFIVVIIHFIAPSSFFYHFSLPFFLFLFLFLFIILIRVINDIVVVCVLLRVVLVLGVFFGGVLFSEEVLLWVLSYCCLVVVELRTRGVSVKLVIHLLLLLLLLLQVACGQSSCLPFLSLLLLVVLLLRLILLLVRVQVLVSLIIMLIAVVSWTNCHLHWLSILVVRVYTLFSMALIYAFVVEEHVHVSLRSQFQHLEIGSQFIEDFSVESPRNEGFTELRRCLSLSLCL